MGREKRELEGILSEGEWFSWKAYPAIASVELARRKWLYTSTNPELLAQPSYRLIEPALLDFQVVSSTDSSRHVS